MRRAKRQSGDVLHEIAEVAIRMEDGQIYEFDVDAEVRISRETAYPELLEMARDSAGQVAFWNTQAERALAAVRQKERKLEALEAELYFTVRSNLEENSGYASVTDKMVAAGIAIQSTVREKKQRLDKARRHYGIVRGLRDAVSQRAEILKRLVAARA